MYVEDVEDTIFNFGVHSTVYKIYVEDIEDMIINIGVHRRRRYSNVHVFISGGRSRQTQDLV